MKRLILTLAFVLFASLAWADDGVIKHFSVDVPANGTSTIFGTVCIDGFKFAFMKAFGANGVSLVQIFREFNPFANPPVPVKCKN